MHQLLCARSSVAGASKQQLASGCCRPSSWLSLGNHLLALFTTGGKEGELQLSDLIKGLGKSRKKLGPARKTLERLQRKGAAVAAPLPSNVQVSATKHVNLPVAVIWDPWTGGSLAWYAPFCTFASKLLLPLRHGRLLTMTHNCFDMFSSVVQARQERKAAYEVTSEDVTKWQAMIKVTSITLRP